MWFTIIVSVVSVIGMFVSLVFFPTIRVGKLKFQTFYFAPLLGAILLLSFQAIPFSSFWSSLTSSNGINPLEILVLFLSMSVLSLALDEAGFFSYLAKKVAKRAGRNQFVLFILLYLLASVLTIFTSNDIVILTLTPFILFFSKESNIDPKPYLVSEFVAANTWSMLLLIGNPTNIYLGVSFGIDFFPYLSRMWLAAILSGVAGFLLMLLAFHRKLRLPLSKGTEDGKLKDVPLTIISLSLLAMTIVMMAINSFVKVPMWLVALIGAATILVIEIIFGIARRDVKPLLSILKRPPYSVVPFIISMFVLVLALSYTGVTASFGEWLSATNPYLGYGLSSFLASNLFNNIPMSVFYTAVISEAPSYSELNVYLTIISSNIGAYLTPVGALAGFMWEGILKEHNQEFGIKHFLLYLTPISIVSLACAFLGLFIVY